MNYDVQTPNKIRKILWRFLKINLFGHDKGMFACDHNFFASVFKKIKLRIYIIYVQDLFLNIVKKISGRSRSRFEATMSYKDGKNSFSSLKNAKRIISSKIRIYVSKFNIYDYIK